MAPEADEIPGRPLDDQRQLQTDLTLTGILMEGLGREWDGAPRGGASKYGGQDQNDLVEVRLAVGSHVSGKCSIRVSSV
jgi:hypothetical protein